MKNEKMIQTHYNKKMPLEKAKSINRFKNKSQLIMEEYAKPAITEDKIYMIDKVVRMRG
jgi:hypothetical protein